MPELTLSAHSIAGSRFISMYALIGYVLFISKRLFVVVVVIVAALLAPWVPPPAFGQLVLLFALNIFTYMLKKK